MSLANLKWKLRFIIIVLSVYIQTGGVLAADRVRIWQDNLVLPTYRMNPDDVNPVFKRPLSYQGALRVIYPYPQLALILLEISKLFAVTRPFFDISRQTLYKPAMGQDVPAGKAVLAV